MPHAVLKRSTESKHQCYDTVFNASENSLNTLKLKQTQTHLKPQEGKLEHRSLLPVYMQFQRKMMATAVLRLETPHST